MFETREDRMRDLVERIVQQAPPPPPFPEPEEMNTRPRTRRLAIAAAALSIVVIASSIAIIATQADDKTQPSVLLGGPDAEVPAIAWGDDDGVWTRNADGTATQIAPESACCVSWAPGERYLAFERDDFLKISDGATTATLGPVGRWAWSPVDPIVAATKTEGDSRRVLLADAQGNVSGTVEGNDFAWASSGRQLAYTRTVPGANGPHDALYIADVAGGRLGTEREVPVAPMSGVDYGLLLATWSPDGSHVLAWINENHSSSGAMEGEPLVAIDVTTGEVTQLFDSLIVRSWLQWSPDGTTLLGVRSSGRMVIDIRQIVRCTLDGRCANAAEQPQTTDPAWSPDGSRYAFVSNPAPADGDFGCSDECDWRVRYARRELWIANADGNEARRVEPARTGVAAPRWVDDKTLVFVRDARLWRLDFDDGEEDGALQVTALTPQIRLADSPDAAVYDPTDIQGTPWDQVVATALPSPSHPTPTPTSTSTSTSTSPPPADTGTVIMPEVTNMSVTEARAALEQLGFTVETVESGRPANNGDLVIWQDPPAGTPRDPGRAAVGPWAPLGIARIYVSGANSKAPPPAFVDDLQPSTYWRDLDLAQEPWAALTGWFDTREAMREAFARATEPTAPDEASVFVATSVDDETLWVQSRNLPDDSADGLDYRFFLIDDGNGAVRVDRAEVRTVCARGAGISEGCL